MRQIRSDLWETRVVNPFPGLTTHAYLWTGATTGNVLFYSTATDADFDEMTVLGGIAHQYLSHRDEAGPQLALIKSRFGAVLHAPAVERADIGKHTTIDIALTDRHVDENGIEVIPTPGHTPGSTCYLVPGANGQSYLFTGDTMFVAGDGRWSTFVIPGVGDTAAMADSLNLLANLRPDVVISSAFGARAVTVLDEGAWPACVEQARRSIPVTS